jgi:hypothetical protein
MLSSQNPYSPERIDALTKTLSTMDPRARQQYAAQHKNDPAVIAVALNVNNILRAAENSKAMQAGSQQQPKVVDQEIAGMAPPPQQMMSLPEDQGIARLPTPNMQNMADGGIAGYDDGGMTGASEFDYAQRSEPVVRMAYGGEIKKYSGKGEQLVRTTDGGKSWFLDIPKTIRDPSVPYYREIPNPKAALADMKFPSRAAALEAITTANTQYASTPGGKPYSLDLGSALPTVDNIYTTPEGKRYIRDTTQTSKEFGEERKQNSRQVQASAFQGPNDPIVPRFQPGISDVPAFAAPAAAKDSDVPASNVAASAAAPAAGGVKDLLPAPPKLDTGFKSAKAPTTEEAAALGDKFFNSKARINEINRQVLQEQADVNTAKENSIAALEAFNKKQGPAFAGYEQTLKKEELQDATDKEKAGLMALFKGFLGVAAGESPNAAVNMAKGAMLGLDDYSGAMKDLKKSAKERNKEMQYIEQARRAEDRGNFDKAQMYEDKAETSRQASARFGIAAINDITNAGGKASADIFNTMSANTSRENVARMQESGQTARTKATIEAQLNTPDRLVFNQLLKDNKNDPVAAAEALQKMKTEKFNVYDSYSKYLTAFANKEGVSPPLPFDQYAKQFIPEVSPNKNTTIRTQPGG